MTASHFRGTGRLLRWAGWCVLALGLIVGGSAALLRWAIWPNLARWQPQIEQQLGRLAGRPVRIGTLAAGFEGWRPWIVATDVRIRDEDGADALVVERLRAMPSIRAALRGHFGLALLESEALAVRIERLAPDRIRIAGFERTSDAPGGFPGWLLAQRRIVLHAARIELVDRVEGRRADLSGIDLVWGVRGRRMRGSVRIPAWGTLASGIDAAFEFGRPASGASLDWRQWRGQAWVGVRGIDLAGALAAGRPWLEGTGLAGVAQSLGIGSGRAGFRLWAFLDPDAANRTVLRLAADELQARVAGEPIPVSGLRLDARSSHDAVGRTTIVFERVELVDDRGQRFDAGVAEPMLRLRADGLPVAARAALADFEAAPVLDWVRRFPLPADIRALLSPLQVDGRVHRAAFTWSTEPDEAHGVFDADFEGLSFFRSNPAPLQPEELRLPGFRNLSGKVRVTRQGGEADLHGRDLQLVFPGLFAEPVVTLQRLDARATWEVDSPGGDAQPTARGTSLPAQSSRPASLPPSSSPPPQTPREAAGDEDEAGLPPAVTLRIEAMRFANADAAGELAGTWRSGGNGPGIVDLSGRLERADARRTARYLPLVVPGEVRDWVRDAIRAGHSDDVRFVIRGDLDDFPWRNPASGLFRVEVKLADGRLAYAPGWPAIERIDGQLRFERAGLQIDARTGQVWRVGLDSVHARIGDFDEPMLSVEGSGRGPAQDLLRFLRESPLAAEFGAIGPDITLNGEAALQLTLDVPLEAPERTRARGAIRLDGNEVSAGKGLPRFEQLAGRIDFTEDSVTLRDLRARVLGGILHLHGEATASGRLQVVLEGDLAAPALARWRLAAVDEALAERVAARLSGPIGFTGELKQDGPVSSFRLDSDLADVRSDLPQPFVKAAGEAWPVRLALTSTLTGRELLDIALPERARLIVEHDRSTNAEVFRRGVLAIGPASVVSDALPAEGLTVRIQTPELDLDAWTALAGMRSGSAAPEGVDELQMLTEQFPQKLPALDVAVDHFIVGGRALGALQLQAENDAPASGPMASRWRVRHLQLDQPAGRLEASGTWQARQAGTPAVSDLRFSLAVIDGGALLDLFGFPGVLSGGRGELSGQIAWHGSPVHLDTRSLSGDIALSMGRGQFLKSDPGIAKLIGVLNLQSLRRRLVFDFRDLFAEGFAFESMSGSAQIVDGVAHTGDFRMKGVTAQVAIRGRADLAEETQALVVQVRPEFDAGLASLAYAALANPVLGLGTFVAQMVLREPLQQMFGHEYDVTGAWNDPLVVRRARPASTQALPPS